MTNLIRERRDVRSRNNRFKNLGVWKKLVALLCVTCLGLSLGVTQNVKAAQVLTSSNVASAKANTTAVSADIAAAEFGSGLSLTQPAAIFGTQTLMTVGLITATLLVGYNVFTSGKQGWGWFTLVVLAGVIVAISRLGVSVFREIAAASTDSVTDWDSD